MNIIIKSLANFEENYNRFGKLIPTKETEIDIVKFFNIKKERESYILAKLKADKKIEVKEIEVKKEKPVEIAPAVKEEVKEVTEETPTRGRKPRGN